MTLTGLVIAWWMFGFSAIVWLTRARLDNILWGELLFMVLLAFGGPIVFAVVALAVLVNAEFWHKPVMWWKKQ